jgi:Zn-dependent peptidase ImmA (M78 family)
MEKPRYSYARQMAIKLLKDCRIKEPPVDLEMILGEKGYNYIEVGHFPDKVDALYIESEGVCYFAVNAKHHLHRKRFSVAHEFGHVMLKHNLAYYYKSTICWDNPPNEKTHTNAESALEKEANAFAGELLVPFDMLKSRFAATREIAELAKMFLVSQQVMGIAISTHMKALYK